MAQVAGQTSLRRVPTPQPAWDMTMSGGEARPVEVDRGAGEGLAGDDRALERADVAVDALGGRAVFGGAGDDPEGGGGRPRALGEIGDLPPLPCQPLAEGAELRREVLVREEDAHARSWKPVLPVMGQGPPRVKRSRGFPARGPGAIPGAGGGAREDRWP